MSVRRACGRRRGRLHILTATVADDTGEIRATWFNQPWLETQAHRRHPRPDPRVGRTGTGSRSTRTTSAMPRTRPTSPPSTRPRGSRPEASSASVARPLSASATTSGDPAACRPPRRARGCRCERTRSSPCTTRTRSRRRSSAGSGSRSTSCSRFSSRSSAASAEREALVAEALPDPGELLDALPRSAPVHATAAQEQAIAEIDARSGTDDADAAPAAGRRRLGQDRRRASTRCCARSRRDARAR